MKRNSMIQRKTIINISAIFLFALIMLFSYQGFSQKDFFKQHTFTQKDTLRGMLSPARTCFDVQHYTIDVQLDISKSYLSGFVDMEFEAVEEFLTLQVDLFSNLKVNKVVRLDNQKVLDTRRKYNAVFINMGERVAKGTTKTIRIYYSGKPMIAVRPPWEGGFVYALDGLNRDFVAVACEGIGASLWWPNKDHLSDEPEKGVDIKIAVPKGLTCVSNGQFIERKVLNEDFERFHWRVTYPINNYNVTFNIAHYAHFSDTLKYNDGTQLPLDYYVLDYNLEKAKKHFKQVKTVLESYNHYFGKYPFMNDGFTLVETPYLGMEHQGAIAYGNEYKRGYLGGVIPDDMNFDYIIVHETGHEYFGNSVSCNDHAEMWIHESFTTYMETLFVEYTRGYDDAIRYINNQKNFVENIEPIIAPLDVNFTNFLSSDYYYKGALILNTLRHTLQDDEKWFAILRGFYDKYALKNIDSEDFFNYFNKRAGRDYYACFQQYFYYPKLPILEYKLRKKGRKYELKYRWKADVKSFDMPVGVEVDGKRKMLFPHCKWQKMNIKLKEGKAGFKVLEQLFLVNVKKC